MCVSREQKKREANGADSNTVTLLVSHGRIPGQGFWARKFHFLFQRNASIVGVKEEGSRFLLLFFFFLLLCPPILRISSFFCVAVFTEREKIGSHISLHGLGGKGKGAHAFPYVV